VIFRGSLSRKFCRLIRTWFNPIRGVTQGLIPLLFNHCEIYRFWDLQIKQKIIDDNPGSFYFGQIFLLKNPATFAVKPEKTAKKPERFNRTQNLENSEFSKKNGNSAIGSDISKGFFDKKFGLRSKF